MSPLPWKISTPRVAQASLYTLVLSTGPLRIISVCLRMSSFHLGSWVRGYHLYKDVWKCISRSSSSVRMGKQKRPRSIRIGSPDGLTGRHFLGTISCLCSVFAWCSGSIVCTITALPQGGLELPCTYTFNGPEDTVKKMKQRLIEEGPGTLYECSHF